MFYLQGRSTGTIGWIRLLELFLYPRPNLVGACLEMVTSSLYSSNFPRGIPLLQTGPNWENHLGWLDHAHNVKLFSVNCQISSFS